MDIQIDTREKARAIKKILAHFDKSGIQYCSSKLFVGDYMNMDNPRVIVDRKQDLREIYSNLCHQHERFVGELKRADKFGIKLIILCEHGKGIQTLEDVQNWYNPQLDKTPYAWDGKRLYKVMHTIAIKYGVEWHFCDKQNTGAEIVRLLKNE